MSLYAKIWRLCAKKINFSRISKWTSILHVPPNSSSHPPLLEALQIPLQTWVPLFLIIFPLLPQCPCGLRSRRHASLPGLPMVRSATADGTGAHRQPPCRTNLMAGSNRCSSPASYRHWVSEVPQRRAASRPPKEEQEKAGRRGGEGERRRRSQQWSRQPVIHTCAEVAAAEAGERDLKAQLACAHGARRHQRAPHTRGAARTPPRPVVPFLVLQHPYLQDDCLAGTEGARWLGARGTSSDATRRARRLTGMLCCAMLRGEEGDDTHIGQRRGRCRQRPRHRRAGGACARGHGARVQRHSPARGGRSGGA
jgi:hypothetical protein